MDCASIFSLPPENKNRERHLATCSACQRKHSQYQLIVSKIRQTPKKKPRFSVTDYVEKQGLGQTLKSRVQDWTLQLKVDKWSRVPLILRTSLEVIAISTLALTALSAVPRIKEYVEEKSKQNLSQELALIDSYEEPSPDFPASLFRKRTTPEPTGESLENAPVSEAEELNAAADQDEFQDDAALAEEGSNSDSATTSGGASTLTQEVWRFNLKTGTPRETSQEVETLLKKQGARNTSNPQAQPQGLRVPGGIQFDLIVPSDQILQVKNLLQALVETDEQASESRTNSEARVETGRTHFTWYRSPAKKRIPAGYSRVVIWLSQI